MNSGTSSELAFYGVQLELWRIDNSRPAVRFNVISAPADIVRQAAIASRSADLSETRRLQHEFWTAFRERLLASGRIPSVQSARPQYWYDVSLGRTGIHLSNILNTYDNRIGVRVYISNQVAGAALPQLMEMRDEIENEIGVELRWDPNPDSRDKVIALFHDGDLANRAKWDEYLSWMVDYTIRFREVFSKRIKEMDLTAAPQEADEPDEEVDA